MHLPSGRWTVTMNTVNKVPFLVPLVYFILISISPTGHSVVEAAHPIVIVNNNHNNHQIPFLGANNVTSDTITVDADSPIIFDQGSPAGEFTTGGTVPFLPSSNGPNTGSIISLDDTMSESNVNGNGNINDRNSLNSNNNNNNNNNNNSGAPIDPFSLFFSTDQSDRLPIVNFNGSFASPSSHSGTVTSATSNSPNSNNMNSNSNNNNHNGNVNNSKSSSTPSMYIPPVMTNLQPSSTPSTLSRTPLINSNGHNNSNNNKTDLHGSSSESKLRWVDYRSRPALPPRVPPVPGIPSGFRNPGTTMAPPTIFGHSNPNLAHNFGPSSSNPVGFAGAVPPAPASFPASNANQDRRRPMPNITRVEHIAAECSDDYMKVTIHYNGTFTGLVYSSGYVHDPNCIYVNGTGRNHYEFFIRLNQCGTLGRQEMYHPKRPGEVRRRDQVMWNTLSIQYNPLIEEEFDEHYRVTCEYGSDFWKTVTFPAVNVEVNTGSPVVFTINPPQCQMEVRRGFGTAGSRTSGPVTVGDPLTLLIHMKSEKAGFDILVKNCIAHNGAQQRLQLIDPNGCVTNEKLISPFRGTYNTDDGHQVTLYAYLKAFRFTGSPALYLECDIHMCHNKCPPQRCYWRNLSKRSVRSVNNNSNSTFITSVTSGSNSSSSETPVISESISLFQALEVRHEPAESEESTKLESTGKQLSSHLNSNLCFRPDGVAVFGVIIAIILIASTTASVSSFLKMKKIRKMYEMQSEASNSLFKNGIASYENLCYDRFNRRRF